MNYQAIAALVSLVSALATLWVSVLWIRPAVARARVHHEVLVVQDRLWNAMHDGEIDWSSERALNVYVYCEVLLRHPKELCLSNALAMATTLHRAGKYDETTEASKARQEALRSHEAEGQTSVGNRILQECEFELDRTVGWYFSRGSAIWPVLTPLTIVANRLARRLPNKVEHSHIQAFEHDSVELATEYRETAVVRNRKSDAVVRSWADLSGASKINMLAGLH
ncbi:hypothetical protein [Williamsia muralis]|uniref:Uncharacterized protein n=1 Tax=Williamsia marianensis TaxID=85044 RepID=A0ABU4EVV5_WILMA|nr:hypothetical protein [Williamsia muralis]MDV7135383.1 hypothetical protein [Williamsia muralis]